MNRAERIVGVLLENLPGVDEATLNKIMQVIYRAVDSVKSGNPNADRHAFEQAVNPLLREWSISFSSDDPMLNQHSKPARAGLDGLVLFTPKRINRREFAYIREIISHEMVHGDQMSRAMRTGNALKMYQSAHRKILPQGSEGPVDMRAYYSDPHEVTAHARSAVDRMRQGNTKRPEAIASLKAGHLGHQHKGSPEAYKRFLKHAAGYAQDLPEQ